MEQSRDHLIEHLREQMQFLRASGAAYDAGRRFEAKRIALVLRVLLHHSKGSKALLEQLGIRQQLAFYDNVRLRPDAASKVILFSPLKTGFDGTGHIWFPHLERPSRQAHFDVYWDHVVFVDGALIIRRSDLILSVADQDGGAHVDPKLRPVYAQFSRVETMTLIEENIETKPASRPHLPLIRQFAAEVEWTLTEQVPHLLGLGSI